MSEALLTLSELATLDRALEDHLGALHKSRQESQLESMRQGYKDKIQDAENLRHKIRKELTT